MRVLKQNTAAHIMLFMTDVTDHITGKAGLTLAITESKNGGAFNGTSPTVTDRGNGWYDLALVSGDTDTLGDLAVHIAATGADPTDALYHVVAYDFGDAVALGLSRLDAAVSSRSVPGDAMTLTGGAVDAILDDPTEGSVTMRQMLRGFFAALTGKSAGGGTATITFRDNADTKNRISATVDASGNRTAVTLDLT